MQIGFLILAHRYPNQLKNLIQSLLLFNSSKIYIHIDLKNLKQFIEVINFYKSNSRVVFIEEKYKVYWGSYNQILATLALIKAAVSSNSEEYFMLISGQDYLIKQPNTVIDFFKQNNGKEFLVNFKLPDVQWHEGGLTRLGNFHFNFPKHPWFTNKLNAAIAKFQNAINFKRKVVFNQYGGSNWFNLSYNALKYVVEYVNTNPHYLKSFKYSLTADEIFIQSILLNSQFKENIINADLRFIDWGTGPEYPRIFRTEDYNRLINSENKFFARKFDETIDKQILINLKNYIES